MCKQISSFSSLFKNICSNGTRKIPPWSILSRWIPPYQIPPNLTLTQTLTQIQVGIHRGQMIRGEFSGHRSNELYKIVLRKSYDENLTIVFRN